MLFLVSLANKQNQYVKRYELILLMVYHFCNLDLIIFADWEASAGDWELNDEDEEEDDHVDEKHHLW